MPDEVPVRRVALGVLALAMVLFTYPLIRAFYDLEIDYNEGWNAYLQAQAAAGQTLYSDAYFNNYPPLSFHLIGALGQMTGDVVLAGRLVSLLALGVIAWACGAVVRSADGSNVEVLFSMATCLLLFACFATDYLGMNDPQLLAQAMVMGALVLHLRGRKSWLVAVLLALALLTKHNILLLPVLIAVDQLRRGSNRERAAFLGTGLLIGGGALVWLWTSHGAAFWQYILAPRTWAVDRAFLFTMEILGRFQAPLALVGIGLWVTRRQHANGLVLAWAVLAVMLGAYFSGGAGTDINVWFDVMIALGIGAGLVLKEARERGLNSRWQAALMLAINAGALFFAPQALGRFGVEMAGDMAARQTGFRSDVAWLKAQSGQALCQSQLLCLRAGKANMPDPFNTTQAVLTGRLPAATLAQADIVQISDRPQQLPDDPPSGAVAPARFVNFPDEFFATLQKCYRLERVGVSGRFYRRKQGCAR